MRSWDSICPVCLRKSIEARPIRSAVPWQNDGRMENRTHCDDALLVHCRACGEFVVTGCDRENLRSERLRTWNSAHLSALLREQTIRGLPPFWLQFGMAPYGPLEREDFAAVDLDELLKRWPRAVPDRLNRTLCNIARLSPAGGHSFAMDYDEDAVIFAETPEEANFIIQCLIDRRYLYKPQPEGRGAHTVALTADGWERFEQLTHGTSSRENPVFVAMWFGVKAKKADDELTEAEMKDLYDRGIEPGVRDAGYDVTRVDLAEHNEWIMDKVLGDIRLSPFVVADFTGNRNGVYFEAGFARGLGIQVIHTCKEDHFQKAHFDTKQLNHILWKTFDELRERLRNRIMATQGRGPYPPPTALGQTHS